MPQKIRNKLSEFLELPREVVLDIPILRFSGNNELFVENYKGLIEYTANKMRIKTSIGVVRLEGEGLMLKRVTGEDLLVMGRVTKIEFL